MIPSRILVLALLVPLALGLAAAAEPGLLWPMLAGDGAIAVAALLDALLSRGARVTVVRRCDPVFSIGRSNRVTLELRSHARRTLDVQVTDDLFDHASAPELPLSVRLPPRGRATVSYEVVPGRRGAHTLGDHHVRFGSLLGLWIRQLHLRDAQAVRVYPDVQAVRAYELLAHTDRASELVRAIRRHGGESEFECLREYSRDDEYRAIDWKATARRHKVISRQYQLERNQSIVFALDCGRLMTEPIAGIPMFDHALNSALMLAWVAARAGDHIGAFAFADDVRSFVAPAGGADVVRRLVRSTFDVHPSLVETDFRAAFVRLGAQLRKRSLIVLFTQVIDDRAAAELLNVTRSLAPRHLVLCVLLRDPGLDALARPTAGDAETLYTAAAAAELLSWRDRLVRELQRARALVLDVAPAAITPQLLQRYLDIKVRQLL
jgi:uncharacterized protein (DUF58 family)